MEIQKNGNDGMPKFPLGRIVATACAIEMIPPEEIRHALYRHVSGDWGNLDDYDREQNAMALKGSGRLFSVYHTEAGKKFYVITEHDRSVTTVLLPEDY